MSVFIGDTLTEDGNQIKKTKKKYFTKYNVKYQEEYPWALPSSKGELHAFCHLCHVDICIKSVGAKGLRDHEATCRHSQKAHQMGMRTSNLPLLAAPTNGHPRFSSGHSFGGSDGGVSQVNSSRDSRILPSQNEVPYSYDVSTYPSQSFTQTASNGSRGPQIQTQVSSNSLLLSSHPPTLSSSMYPMLEVGDIETQPACRSPRTPQTPNTPSSPFHQDHFVSLDPKVNTGGADMVPGGLECHIPEEILPPSSSSYSDTKLNSESTITASQYQNSSMSRETKETKGYMLSLRDSGSQYILPPNEMQPTSTNAINTKKQREAYSSILCEDSNVVTDEASQEPEESSTGNSEGESTEQMNINVSWTLDDDPENKNSSLSVEDLTCNVCGEVFLDWKELKKDLLEHVKEAQKGQTNISGSSQPQASVNTKKKCKRATIKAKKVSKVFKPCEKRKRGRPPGSKKKVLLEEECDFGSNLFDSTSNTSNFSQVEPAANSSTVLTNKTVRRRGRPLKNKTLLKEVPNDNDSLLCAPPDEEYWVETFELSSQPNVSVQESSKDGTPQIGTSTQQPSRRSGQIQCRVCKAMFYLRKELREHYKNEHNNGRPYECEICHKYFTTKNHLQVHKKHKHIIGANPCLCAVCGKTLSSRTNLKIHMMIHKGERPFSCPICEKPFSRKANMEMHIVYHTGERKFTCEICGQSFFAINALKRHKKLHTGERDYECDICGASYVTGTDLRRHRLKHDDVKPFPCNICEKQFTRAHDLKVHLRYHNKELRFACNICGKQFVESGNYRRHMRRHTGERPYTCHICQQTFSQVHHYKVHMRTNHSEQENSSTCDTDSIQGRTNLQRGGQTQKSLKKGAKMASVTSTSCHANLPSQADGTIVTTAVGLVNNSLQNHIHAVHHLHNQAALPCAVTQINTIGNMTSSHASHVATVTPPVAHASSAGGVSMMTPHHSQVPPSGVGHPTAGFLQYNYNIYNTSVIPQYPTLFDICPQQPSGSHIGSH